MNIKDRLAKLEASIPAIKENHFVFTTRAGSDNSQITGFKYKDSNIVRVVGEEMESVKDRAAVFFAENNPDQSTFFIQAVYGVD